MIMRSERSLITIWYKHTHILCLSGVVCYGWSFCPQRVIFVKRNTFCVYMCDFSATDGALWTQLRNSEFGELHLKHSVCEMFGWYSIYCVVTLRWDSIDTRDVLVKSVVKLKKQIIVSESFWLILFIWACVCPCLVTDPPVWCKCTRTTLDCVK